MMLEPIPTKNPLAGNPIHELQFKIEIQNRSGSKISVADPRATRAMIALMDMNAVLGGAASHYGGPAAMAEMKSALYGYIFDEVKSIGKQWFDFCHVVNDAGHCENGLYALKANYQMAGLNLKSLRLFRSIEGGLTGHGEAHLFPEGVFLSNGPLGSAFPQAQGLALGEKISGKNRITYTIISDGACMEGEAKEAFTAIPGLAAKGMLAPFVLLISDNNTKLTGRIDQDAFSMAPTFASLKALGWNVIELENGHDLQKFYNTIAQATDLAIKNPQVPVAIHAKTIKGVGTKKTAESASGGHGFPLKSPTELAAFLTEIYGGEKFPQEFSIWIEELLQLEKVIEQKAIKDTGVKIQNGVSAAMIRARKEGLPIISVTSDLPGSTGVAGFRKEFPRDSFDVGVAESNMVSTAAGLSKLGFIPVVDTFAQFGVTKGALPLTMASLSLAPIIAVFSHTGFQDAADGASHQALSYLAMIGSIPHVKAIALTCSEEAEELVYQALLDFSDKMRKGQVSDSYVFFLGRENFPKSFSIGIDAPLKSYKLGDAQVVLDTTSGSSKSVCLAAPGSMVGEALKAAAVLKEKGIGAVVINPSILNKIDFSIFSEALKKCDNNLVTVEDHQLQFGYGQFLTHQLVLHGIRPKLSSLGVHAEFGQSAYNAIELYSKHKLDSKAIVEAALSLVVSL